MKTIIYLLFIIFLMSPLLLFSQDTTAKKINRIEISSLVNLLFGELDCGSEIFLSTNAYLCGRKNDFGITYFRNLRPGRFEDDLDRGYYGVDSGGGRTEHGIRLSYRRVLHEGGRIVHNSRVTLNIGVTYLWGKIPYAYLKSPGTYLYAVREKGVIFSSGISWHKRITGPLWFTSTVDSGLRLVSMKKGELSLRDSKQFFNLYLGAGLTFRF